MTLELLIHPDPCINLELLIHPDTCINLELLIHPDPCVNLELLIHPDVFLLSCKLSHNVNNNLLSSCKLTLIVNIPPICREPHP